MKLLIGPFFQNQKNCQLISEKIHPQPFDNLSTGFSVNRVNLLENSPRTLELLEINFIGRVTIGSNQTFIRGDEDGIARILRSQASIRKANLLEIDQVDSIGETSLN